MNFSQKKIFIGTYSYIFTLNDRVCKTFSIRLAETVNIPVVWDVTL